MLHATFSHGTWKHWIASKEEAVLLRERTTASVRHLHNAWRQARYIPAFTLTPSPPSPAPKLQQPQHAEPGPWITKVSFLGHWSVSLCVWIHSLQRDHAWMPPYHAQPKTYYWFSVTYRMKLKLLNFERIAFTLGSHQHFRCRLRPLPLPNPRLHDRPKRPGHTDFLYVRPLQGNKPL